MEEPKYEIINGYKYYYSVIDAKRNYEQHEFCRIARWLGKNGNLWQWRF